jgi:tetratricopeptide (TPR) repeat protein
VFALCLLFAALALAPATRAQATPGTPRLGKVSFPVSCAPGVQDAFDRGVAWLHSFEFEEAEKSFREVAQQDPHCAMAEWGIAMSLWHPLWDHPHAESLKRGAQAVAQAESLSAQTPRERDYIAAIAAFYKDASRLSHQERAAAYSRAMQQVYERYPQDLEAAAFYGLSLLAAEPSPDPGLANRKQAAPVLEAVFAKNPEHPGAAHYLIHAYDTPELAPQGLKAAREYARIAPTSPHALHMPSHIFTRLGLWQESIASNLASEAAAEKVLEMGGAGHAMHALDFLHYSYLQSGQDAAARAVMDKVAHAAWMNSEDRSANFADLEERYALETHDWKKAAALELPRGAGLRLQAAIHWARSIAEARQGNPIAARKELQELQAQRSKLAAEHDRYGPNAFRVEWQEAAAWEAQAEGKRGEAVQQLRAAAKDEEILGGPFVLGIPAGEMLGDLLLEQSQPAEALAAYQGALKESPNRFNSLWGAGRAAELAGQKQKARSYYQALLNSCTEAEGERPELRQARAYLKSTGMD